MRLLPSLLYMPQPIGAQYFFAPTNMARALRKRGKMRIRAKEIVAFLDKAVPGLHNHFPNCGTGADGLGFTMNSSETTSNASASERRAFEGRPSARPGVGKGAEGQHMERPLPLYHQACRTLGRRAAASDQRTSCGARLDTAARALVTPAASPMATALPVTR
jgi:hypothetical protein